MNPLAQIFIAAVAIPAFAFAGSKTDPADWILWRAAPIAFPDSITPQVPELMQGEAAIDFQKATT